MAFIPTAGAVRTDIMFHLNGQEVHNIIWCSREANWTQTEREGLNNAIASWWNTTGKGQFAGNIALARITTVNQESNSAPGSTLVVSPEVAGTKGGASLAGGSALVATLRTDQRGRNYRGRMYLGGISEADRGGNEIGGGLIANIITALLALKTAIEALGAIWVVVSHFLNKVPRAQGLKTPITAISMDSYLDSQRRRLTGRGV